MWICVCWLGCAGEEFSSAPGSDGGAGTAGSGGTAGGSGCPGGQKRCGDACVSRELPQYGCGQTSCAACQLANASAKCESGHCAVDVCQGTFGDCDQDPANGCETNLNSAESCGACGKACPSNQVCSGGQCAASCPSGQTPCAGGCVDIATDIAHCGGCGAACTPPPNMGNAQCVAAKCEFDCITGYGDCDSNTPGCETSIHTDSKNCGSCGKSCPAASHPNATAASCIQGSCGRDGGRTLCGNAGSGACLDTQNDPRACGSTCDPCGFGGWCDSGSCDYGPCPLGLTSCGGQCVSTESDANHCGGCGKACGSGLACKQGSCISPAACTTGSYVLCSGGSEDDSCPHLLLDTARCGTCTTSCGTGQACIGGVCKSLLFAAEPWECTMSGKKACLLPNDWLEKAHAPYFCEDDCPWGQAP